MNLLMENVLHEPIYASLGPPNPKGLAMPMLVLLILSPGEHQRVRMLASYSLFHPENIRELECSQEHSDHQYRRDLNFTPDL